MLPVFSYRNLYAATSRIRAFARIDSTSVAAAQLLAAVLRPVSERRHEASFHDVMKLYAAFQPMADGSGWRSVQAICEALPHLARSCDMRALVHVGLLNGILRIVRTVPLRIESELAHSAAPGSPALTMAEGHHDLDAICCTISAPVPEVKRSLGQCAWISQ